ncbi:MAG: serine hydrolase [Acidobacteriota bacterium]
MLRLALLGTCIVGSVALIGGRPIGFREMRVGLSQTGLPKDTPASTTRLSFDSAIAEASQLSRLRSLLISIDGALVEEHYFHGAAATRPTNVKSVSKSVMALLVGIAVDRGDIRGIDDPISRYLPASSGAVGDKGGITVEALLTMRSGLETTSNRNYGRWVQSGNWVRHVLQRPWMDESADGRMIYSTGNSHVLSAILTAATRMSTLEFARRYLGAPLGIPIRVWTRDPQGIYLGGNEMSFTSRELIAIGQLYLDGGRRGDRQIVSERWVRDSIQPRARSERRADRYYGYGWWIREMAGEPVFYAWGFGGQFIFVAPERKAIIVTTSVPDPGDDRREQRDAVEDLVQYRILPAIARVAPNSAR